MNTIAVIGAGTMGNGIAHVFAQHGMQVHLIDIQQTQLDKALKTISGNFDRQVTKGLSTEKEKQESISRISTFTSLREGVQDVSLVVEAASEDMGLKTRLFREIDGAAPGDCILATNTSSISVSRIAAVTSRPSKVIGMHFMNPVPVMKLVEVINGYATDTETTAIVVETARKLGKIPCVVNDYPGFIANRILMPMINEAIYSLFEGVAGVEEIDTVMKLGMAHPMGPLQLADFIGLDICLAILQVLHDGFGNPKYAPCPLLVNMVTAGRLGVKSGEGFYTYERDTKAVSVSRRFARSNP
jgi:3-hydroxybutyryl-CoA dehydrogenase